MIKHLSGLLCCVAFLHTEIRAQLNQDDWLVGGTLRVNTASNASQFEFSPSLGYFLIEKLAFGVRMNYATEKLGTNRVNGLGFGPFLRYYIAGEKIVPLIESSFDLSNRKLETGGISSTEQAFSLFGGGGVSVFLNENVALEGILGYRNTRVKNQSGNGGLNLRVGFQIYLNRGQVEGVRSRWAK